MKKISAILLTVLLVIISCSTIINAKSASISAPSSVKLKSKVCGFKVNFKKSKSKVSGYIIKYSVNKTFSKSKKVKISSTKTSKTIKKLKSGKKYYVKICAYNKSSISKWTKVKTVTTKKKSMTSIAVKGLWYLYSPQDTVADVFNFYANGSCKHMSISCNGNKVDQYSNTIVRKCKISSNKMIVYAKPNNYVIKYVRSGDYGKFTTMVPNGPADAKKITFKVFHYPDHPSSSRFMKDWKNKYLK